MLYIFMDICYIRFLQPLELAMVFFIIINIIFLLRGVQK